MNTETNSDTLKNHPDDYLTLAEIAKDLRVSRWTVENWVKNGLLPAINVGSGQKYKQWRVTRAAVEKFKADRSNTPDGKISHVSHRMKWGEQIRYRVGEVSFTITLTRNNYRPQITSNVPGGVEVEHIKQEKEGTAVQQGQSDGSPSCHNAPLAPRKV